VVNTVFDVFTIPSITTETRWTWTATNLFVVFVASHIGITSIVSTALDRYITDWTSEANVAAATVVVHQIYTTPIYTGEGVTIVDVHFASDSSKTSFTVAGEIIDFVEARPMNTRRGLAFVDLNIAIITSVAILAVASVHINFILTCSISARR